MAPSGGSRGIGGKILAPFDDGATTELLLMLAAGDNAVDSAADDDGVLRDGDGDDMVAAALVAEALDALDGAGEAGGGRSD